ncbi:MAG: hypothetical protein IJX65_00825 [Alistipes sp.]|nr:hypothetical protein [Alistipes sp.]
MRKIILALLLLVGAQSISAQMLMLHTTADLNLAEDIMSDTAFERYIWAIGYGSDHTEADNMAMAQLASIDLDIVAVHTSQSSSEQLNVESARTREVDEMEYVGTAMMYLENIHRIDLSNQLNDKDRKVYKYMVLRYVTAEEWARRYDSLSQKINSYLESAKLFDSVVDKLRCYTWAYALLTSYRGAPILVDGKAADQAVIAYIKDMLNGIDVNVIGIEKVEGDAKYPHKLYLDFTYQGEPLSDITFSYFDGGGIVEGEGVKDGRSMVMMSKLPESFTITIDCFMEDQARQQDASIYHSIQKLRMSGQLTGSIKQVETKPKGVKPLKEIDTNSQKVASAVNQKLTQSLAEYGKTSQATGSEEYVAIMNQIVASFSDESIDISHHFTPRGASDFENIVTEGKPVVARTPEWKFVKFDSLVICRELPLKLKFSSSRKSFIEDVVFRINARTKKIESVAYKLSSATERSIMATDWPEIDRLTLITFLEDYRSAYCLRDIAYIKKVFSDDAYIIVGKVLQRSTQQFNDKTELIDPSGKVVYTRYSKKQYVENLQRSFRSKEFINVRFEECTASKGYAAKKNIYAVQVRQLYSSNNYADEGILTLAIDMREEDNPLVRVRVWQQERDVNYTAEQMIERTVSTEGSFSQK